MARRWVQAPPARGKRQNAYNGVYLDDNEEVRWHIHYDGLERCVYGYQIVKKPKKDKDD